MTFVLDGVAPSHRGRRAFAYAAAVVLHGTAALLARNVDAPAATEPRASVNATRWVQLKQPANSAAATPTGRAQPSRSTSTPPRPARTEPRRSKQRVRAKRVVETERAKPAETEVLDLTGMLLSASGPGEADAQGVPVASGNVGPAQDTLAAGSAASDGSTASGHGQDLSRPPRLAGRADWTCRLPSEALARGMRQADVIVRVDVDARGKLVNVTPVRDPGYGFFREASRCAAARRWLPALDRNGRPVRASQLVRVHFAE